MYARVRGASYYLDGCRGHGDWYLTHKIKSNDVQTVLHMNCLLCIVLFSLVCRALLSLEYSVLGCLHIFRRAKAGPAHAKLVVFCRSSDPGGSERESPTGAYLFLFGLLIQCERSTPPVSGTAHTVHPTVSFF